MLQDNDAAHLSTVVDAWLDTFKSSGQDYVPTPRDAIRLALVAPDAPLLRTLSTIIPGFDDHPHPNKLGKWLRSIENLPVYSTTGERFRFMRTEHNAWDLARIHDRERAAA